MFSIREALEYNRQDQECVLSGKYHPNAKFPTKQMITTAWQKRNKTHILPGHVLNNGQYYSHLKKSSRLGRMQQVSVRSSLSITMTITNN